MTFPALFATSARIIQFAYEDAGKVSQGVTPNSEQIARGMERLNDIINYLQTEGLKLWTLSDQEVNLVASQRYYTFLPGGDVDITKPLRALQGYILDTDDNRRPIYPSSWQEWLTLGNPLQEGAITNFFVDKQYNQLRVGFWLVPDATEAANTAHILLQTQITNFEELTETLMFPQEWFLALRWLLAADLATGQPDSIVMRCERNAERYKNQLTNWDVEDAPTQFQIDPRLGYYNQGGFR